LFELVVNGEMAVRQALLRKHSSQAELALYITHGLLHNLGFDDAAEDQAKKCTIQKTKFLSNSATVWCIIRRLRQNSPGDGRMHDLHVRSKGARIVI